MSGAGQRPRSTADCATGHFHTEGRPRVPPDCLPLKSRPVRRAHHLTEGLLPESIVKKRTQKMDSKLASSISYLELASCDSRFWRLPIMRLGARTMTKAKIDANRQNSKRSTGPRTERGKRIARFNAVTLGLFAKHIVIPICDGYKSEKEFQSLVVGLHQEFQPAGMFEEWLVVKIAECMWRLRRAALCENGSVRESAAWTRVPNDDSLAPLFYTRKTSILTDCCIPAVPASVSPGEAIVAPVGKD